MFTGTAKTVSEYLDGLPRDRREVVSKVRRVIKKHLPKGYKEAVNFGIITYEVPLKRYPDTYNKRPLCYAGIAAQKNYYARYLMVAYGDSKQARYLEDEFKKRGKTLDMGKSCLRFKQLDDLPLDVVGTVIASTPMEKYIATYEASRKR
jgi:hypothetical protein